MSNTEQPAFLTGEAREHCIRQSGVYAFVLEEELYDKHQGQEDLRIAIDQGLPVVCFYPTYPDRAPLPTPQLFLDCRGPKLFLKFPGPSLGRRDWRKFDRFLRRNGIPLELLNLLPGSYKD